MTSVITIFYNGDRFIAEAIESVLAQTSEDWELLLVDDGSTDRATAIAQDFAARYPEKIRYFEHPGHANLGMSASRNLGLAHARGEHISYLDADDVLRPDKLEDQARLLREHPEVAYVYGPLELWRSWTGRPSDVDELQDLGLVADRVIQPPELLKLFLRNEKSIPSGVFVRAETFDQKGGYEPAFTGMYEDLVMHAKICLSQPVYAASKSWYRYRQHPDSCNAQAWRTGRDRETRFAFLHWLEGYLRANGADEGEVWEVLQEQIGLLKPTVLQRLPDALWQQARRVKRLANETIRKTRRALGAPPVVLCYHRVAQVEADPHLLAVTPEHFRAQIEFIREIGRPVSLDVLSDGLATGALPAGGIVLTFDDGYLDNLEMALPILREFDVPATIYVATGYIGRDREFWWDDLERLVLGQGTLPRILRLEIDGRAREWDLGEAPDDTATHAAWSVLDPGEWSAREKLFVDLHAALRPLPEARQVEVLEQLRALTGVAPAARPFYRCMNEEELRILAAEPLITLGAHTVTHCDLDFRKASEQAAEIDGSRQRLEKIIGRRVDHFSYPYGSFNDDAVAVCARSGFRSAVSCIEAPVENNASRHALPRFLVRQWEGSVFEQQLQSFFCG